MYGVFGTGSMYWLLASASRCSPWWSTRYQAAPYSSGTTGAWVDMMPSSVFSACCWVAVLSVPANWASAAWACGLS